MSGVADFPRNLAYAGGRLRVLDQSLLPAEERYLSLETLAGVVEAIRSLRVRGAPAIGIAAAYGLCVALHEFLRRESGASPAALVAESARARAALAAARPTAVNLAHALERLERAQSACVAGAGVTSAELLSALEADARALHEEEAALCEAIAEAGLALLPETARLLTHCNAGPLATGGIGTALGIVLRGHERGRRFEVLADETRPLLQGARLTAWELQRAGVPVRLLPDSAAAGAILAGRVDAVLVGADRIAVNGDTANKVGTLPLALACARAGLPFYVAAPSSSFDPDCPDGAAIPIEERAPAELTQWEGRDLAPAGVGAFNPAFDVTPGDLVTAFVTGRGVFRPPYDFRFLGD